MAFSCGARSAFKLNGEDYLRKMLSRRPLQALVGSPANCISRLLQRFATSCAADPSRTPRVSKGLAWSPASRSGFCLVREAIKRCASAASDLTLPSLHYSMATALNRVRCKRLLDAALHLARPVFKIRRPEREHRKIRGAKKSPQRILD
jgi:hypothetical protein